MPSRDKTDTDSLYAQALAAQRDGRLDEAVTVYTQLLQADPDQENALNNLGVALRNLGRLDAAEVCYRRVLAKAGTNAGLCINLGNCLRDQGKLEDALAFYLEALELDAESASAWHGLGLVERDRENLDASIAAFDKSIALAGDASGSSDQYKWDRALSLLRAGQYRDGFQAYESRWTQPGLQKMQTGRPEWDGTPCPGQTLLLYGEQGFGDVIQFARFIPRAAEAFDSVVLYIRPELVPLFENQFSGVSAVIARGADVPHHDAVLPILSLPRLLNIDLPDVSVTPYLRAQDRSVVLPAKRISSSLRIAFAWAGSPTQKNDRNRSFPFLALAPLLSLPTIECFSVQKGPAVEQISDSGLAFGITDLSSSLNDFADTSAVLQQMDLVISCDSAVVHLAGALGKPVWVALSVFHDWRYGIGGDLSLWYGSARVFKQTRAGDWGDIVMRIKTSLEELTN